MNPPDPPTLRDIWRQAKANAQASNNNNEIVIRIGGQTWDLGPSLDTYQNALDRYEFILPGDPARVGAMGDLMDANTW